MKLIKYLFSPLVFGFGFLAPLIAQMLTALDVSLLGTTNLVVGVVIGGLLGLIAQFRGSWIWIKP